MLRTPQTITAVFLCILLVSCGKGGDNSAASTSTSNSTSIPPLADQPPAFTVDATARFNSPGDLSIDSAGNLYVMDNGNQGIRKIAASGNVSTLPGSFIANSRLISDASGNLFVLSTPDIFKVTPDGNKTVIASYPPGPGHYTAVRISLDGQGRLYVLLQYRNVFYIDRIDPDASHHTVYSFTNDGEVLDFASDFHGNLMVANNGPVAGQSYLTAVPQSAQPATDNSAGIWTRAIPLASLVKIVFDADGNLYIADATYTQTSASTDATPSFDVSAIQVRRLGPDNTVTTLLNGFPDGSTMPRHATLPPYDIGITAGANGDIYLSDQFDEAIYKISSAGQISLVAGKPGEAGNAD